MSDDKKRIAIERARRLEASCSEPGGLFEVIADLRRAMLNEVVDIPTAEHGKREALVLEVKALDRIKGRITTIIQAAAYERGQLEDLAKEEAGRVANIT